MSKPTRIDTERKFYNAIKFHRFKIVENKLCAKPMLIRNTDNPTHVRCPVNVLIEEKTGVSCSNDDIWKLSRLIGMPGDLLNDIVTAADVEKHYFIHGARPARIRAWLLNHVITKD